MPREVTPVEYEPESNGNALGDRMDASIGEASSGIGAMLSELVRRSLKTGVSDIGESLTEYAEEQVESAVQRQMPGIAEAANDVAESTSRRVIGERERVLESKIAAAESSAIDRSKDHVTSVVSEVREEANHSQRRIDELNDRARSSWQKVKSEFESLHQTQDQFEQELGRSDRELREQLASVTQQLSDTRQLLQQSAAAAQDRYGAMVAQYDQVVQRLEELERPRGIKKLWAKFSKPKPNKGLPAPEDSTEPATPNDPTPDQPS